MTIVMAVFFGSPAPEGEFLFPIAVASPDGICPKGVRRLWGKSLLVYPAGQASCNFPETI